MRKLEVEATPDFSGAKRVMFFLEDDGEKEAIPIWLNMCKSDTYISGRFKSHSNTWFALIHEIEH